MCSTHGALVKGPEHAYLWSEPTISALPNVLFHPVSVSRTRYEILPREPQVCDNSYYESSHDQSFRGFMPFKIGVWSSTICRARLAGEKCMVTVELSTTNGYRRQHYLFVRVDLGYMAIYLWSVLDV